MDQTPRPTRAEIGSEIATTRDGVDITRAYSGPLMISSDHVLRAIGGDLRTYRELLTDHQVKTCTGQRIDAIVRAEWAVDAASDRRADRRAAEFVRQQLHRVGFDQRTRGMWHGVWYGYAVAECIWGVDDGMIVLDALKVRDRRRFRFSPDGSLRMLTIHRMFDGIELPPFKFWTFCTGADHDDEPYGMGLGHWAYWPVYFRRHGTRFWARFVEKFAAPTVVGKYDQGAADIDKTRLLQLVQSVQMDTGAIMPKDMMVELLEASRTGQVDYAAFADYWDDALAKIILGQTMTTEDGASRAQGEVHLSVRQDIVKADADVICESLNRSVVRWLTHWNFPDADPPRVYRVFDEPEDLDARATRDKTLFDMGFRPTLQHITDVYGGEYQDTTPPPSEPSAEASEFAAPALAPRYTPPDLRALDALLDAIESGAELQQQSAQMLAPLLDGELTPERLGELYPELDDGALQDALDRLLFAASMWGALNAERR